MANESGLRPSTKKSRTQEELNSEIDELRLGNPKFGLDGFQSRSVTESGRRKKALRRRSGKIHLLLSQSLRRRAFFTRSSVDRRGCWKQSLRASRPS